MSKAKTNNGYLGVTEPISLSGPTDKDLMQTTEVEKVGDLYIRWTPLPSTLVLFSLDSCHLF
jgi:hypothetical protein